jgi:hypothetical protein
MYWRVSNFLAYMLSNTQIRPGIKPTCRGAAAIFY